MVEKRRQSNLDLLRVVAMIMIVSLHFLEHGGVLGAVVPASSQFLIARFFEIICIVSVNCFVLISGYFLATSKFKVNKLLQLVAQVLFYSVFIYLLLLFTGKIAFSVPALFSAFLPILSNEYWFITAYVGMYILSPFLNIFVKHLSKKQHAVLCSVLIILFSVWPTIFSLFWKYHAFGDVDYGVRGGYSVIWFVILYLVAAYIRMHYTIDYKAKKHLARYIYSVALISFFVCAATFIYRISNNQHLLELVYTFYLYNSFFVFVESLALFIFFLNLTIKKAFTNKLIAFFSPLTFGVYLIHDNPNLSAFIWKKVDAVSHMTSYRFIFYAAAAVLTIYIACSFIDWFRSKLFVKIVGTKWFKKTYESLIIIDMHGCIKNVFR